MLNAPAVGEEGLVTGYASLFGIADKNGDMVMPGAFRASLASRAAREIKFLFQHDPKEPIGVWLDMREDERGLRVIGRLLAGVGRAREAYALIKAGALDGLSIGFQTKTARRAAHQKLRQLLAIDLWEISLVTFPMLLGARLMAVDAAPKLIKKSALSPQRKANFNSAQPRVPAGNSEGGQWADAGGRVSAERQAFRDYLRGNLNGKPRLQAIEDIRRQREGEVVAAQFRPRGGGRIGARFPNATPGQQARLVAAEVEAQSALRRVREVDPNFKPPASLTAPESIEGEISHLQGVARAAEARISEIARTGIGGNFGPPLDMPAEPLRGALRDPIIGAPRAPPGDGSFDRVNLQSKLREYLLNSSNSRNQGKAEFYRRALELEQNNWRELASQLYFDESKATFQRSTPDGIFYQQIISITGKNGRTIPLKFIFKKDSSGVIRFVTGLPR